jgi:hypothetical protein
LFKLVEHCIWKLLLLFLVSGAWGANTGLKQNH